MLMRQLAQTTNNLIKTCRLALTIMALCMLGHTYAEPVNPELSPAGYKLGIGDKIQIDVYDETDLGMTTTISQTGKISYPFLGDLAVTGLTVKQVEELIISGLKGGYLADPQVSVTILEYRPVFVSGEVKQSGGYPYQPGLTVRKAVSLAGGFTGKASQKKITIIRDADPQRLSTPIALDDFVSPGDTIIIGQGLF
jgi:polysaccharide biosynthesis/export protein VpsN